MRPQTDTAPIDDLLSFWGKASPADGAVAAWHPLLYHALDVAAVCDRFLVLYPALPRMLSAQAGCGVPEARSFLTLLVALHDIGKVSPGFQAKVPQVYPAILGKTPDRAAEADHTACGVALLSDLQSECLSALAPEVTGYAWESLTATVAGHHGRPARDPVGSLSLIAVHPFARAYITACVETVMPSPFPGRLTERAAKALSWGIAGLCMLSDWVGSNQRWFQYHLPDLSPTAYWARVAVPVAARALSQAGLDPLPPARDATFTALTGRTDPPTPLQALAETVPLPQQGPALILIEDVTGAGKTEAALILSVRLMQQGLAQGLYFAMPTMATANAMYRRLDGLAAALFVAGADPQAMLSHGARQLDEHFMAHWQGDGEEGRAIHGDDSSLTASAASTRWLADDRRKAFFAPLGAGTIDQAFLSVLPAKFGPLRLIGLSGRVLIIDEAHAYDAYCVEELKSLIRFHAALGGSAIVLSATLSASLKGELFKAFRLGCGEKKLTAAEKAGLASSAYPLLTCLGAGVEAVSYPVQTMARLCRTVRVQPMATEDAVVSLIGQSVARGAAVAWIRNTVEDVLDVAAALRRAGVDPMVFHARFAMSDRQRAEQDVLGIFGPAGQGRAGRVLVASQVIEQSLDVDFDVVVTDLAPVDLLIQRAGRLWRHRRQRPVDDCCLYVLSPDPVPDAGADWYSRLFPRAAYVYRDHAVLWLSAHGLFAAGELVTPGGVRPLIEGVYGPQADEMAPRGLDRLRGDAEGKAQAERAFARQMLLDFTQGYSTGVWLTDAVVPTRLGEEQTVFRLALWQKGALAPYAVADPWPGEDPRSLRARAWALSEVSVRASRAGGRAETDPAVEAAAVALEERWAEIGIRAVVLPLYPCQAGGYAAHAIRRDGPDARTAVSLRYDPAQGLSFPPDQVGEGG